MKHLMILGLTVAMILNSHDASAKHDSEKGLPPGLQKKQQMGKPLPPGWQKKLHVGATLEADVYAHAKVIVPIGKHGEITVSIDGRILRLHEATRKILEIIK